MRVQHIQTIGGGDELYLATSIESIHLRQNLHQSSSALRDLRWWPIHAARTNGIKFIYEDYCRRLALGQLEELAHEARTLSDYFCTNSEPTTLRKVASCSGYGLASMFYLCPRPVQQNSFRRLDAHGREKSGRFRATPRSP